MNNMFKLFCGLMIILLVGCATIEPAAQSPGTSPITITITNHGLLPGTIFVDHKVMFRAFTGMETIYVKPGNHVLSVGFYFKHEKRNVEISAIPITVLANQNNLVYHAYFPYFGTATIEKVQE